ncbi:MAG: YdbL family protein [Candidatus Eremiobacteraeota bacterium]|nr:YdbL family protein [Candidatus Eremiobacteraeota bacterium]
MNIHLKIKSFVFLIFISIFCIHQSLAIENWTDGPILQKIMTYQEVRAAFERRGMRESQIDKLIKDSTFGESNLGFLYPRFTTTSDYDRKLMIAENGDRKVIMIGIARALLEVEEKPVTQESVRARIPDAIKYFCTLREKHVPKGTWLQDPDGNWLMKK